MPTMTLHDGRQVDACSEDWRHECEARTVLAWPLSYRQTHLVGVAAKRGMPARLRLESTMRAIWTKRKAENLANASPDERAEVLAQIEREDAALRRAVQQAVFNW